MKANYEKHLKAAAINAVESFKGFEASMIKVVSNSPMYPESIVLPFEDYVAGYAGYVFNNQNKEQFALTAVQVSDVLNSEIHKKKCWKPSSVYKTSKNGKKVTETELLRFAIDELRPYAFDK